MPVEATWSKYLSGVQLGGKAFQEEGTANARSRRRKMSAVFAEPLWRGASNARS